MFKKAKGLGEEGEYLFQCLEQRMAYNGHSISICCG